MTEAGTWCNVQLKKVAQVKSGSGFPKTYQGLEDQEYPFFKVGDMNTPGNEVMMVEYQHSISEDIRRKLRATAFPSGTIVFPKIGAAIATNKKRILLYSSCVDNNVMAVVPDQELIYPQYLYYIFLTKNLSDFASDANPPSMRTAEVAAWKIPLPPLPEQRRIVAILRQADELRQLRRRANERAKDLLPALFYEMFGNFVELDQSGFVNLERVAHVVSGVAKGRKLSDHDVVTVPYLRVANVQAGYLDLSEIKTIDALPAEVEKYRLQQGDVLLTEGGDYDKLGRGAFWSAEVNDCIHQNHIFRVRLDQDKVRPRFFEQYLQTLFAKAYFLRAAKRTTNIASINLTQLRALPVPIIESEQQDEFVNIADVLRSVSGLHKTADITLNQLFQSLLARAFTGELTAAWRNTHAVELAKAAAERDQFLGIKQEAQTAQLELPLEANTPADVNRSFGNLVAIADEIVRSQQRLLDQMVQVPRVDLPGFTVLADSLRPAVIPMADIVNEAMQTHLAAINTSLLDSMVQATQPLADALRSQQIYYADFLEKMAQVARIELNEPMTRTEIEAEVLETVVELPKYFTLHNLASDWRLNHLPHHAIEEAVDMLVVLGKLRPTTLKLETDSDKRLYDLVDAFSPVSCKDLIGAQEIEL